MQNRADNQGNQNEGQDSDTIVLASREARKATGFKSQRVSCFEFYQTTSKCQVDFLEKTCKKKF